MDSRIPSDSRTRALGNDVLLALLTMSLLAVYASGTVAATKSAMHDLTAIRHKVHAQVARPVRRKLQDVTVAAPKMVD